ncbi:MAG: hypothetical protein EBZ00_00015 [Actinobacteria bacterium]|nr:hypothetical protein [Actinomycetota bacterium]
MVDQSAWNAHVQGVTSALRPLVPVIKGNGYGFGRSVLMKHATGFSDEVAVGTVYELADVPESTTPIVLTRLVAVLPDIAKLQFLAKGRSSSLVVARPTESLSVQTVCRHSTSTARDYIFSNLRTCTRLWSSFPPQPRYLRSVSGSTSSSR